MIFILKLSSSVSKMSMKVSTFFFCSRQKLRSQSLFLSFRFPLYLILQVYAHQQVLFNLPPACILSLFASLCIRGVVFYARLPPPYFRPLQKLWFSLFFFVCPISIHLPYKIFWILQYNSSFQHYSRSPSHCIVENFYFYKNIFIDQGSVIYISANNGYLHI